MKYKILKINKLKKIIFVNILFLLLLVTTGLLTIEFFLKAKNPYSLFPEKMTRKKNLYKEDSKIKIYDGARMKSGYEPKTNATYKHNYLGFRVNKNSDNRTLWDKNSLNESIISFGDSTSYGLNIDNKDTFLKLVSRGLSKANNFNFSYPGMNLETITYKIQCTNKLLKDNSNKAELSIVSLFYNDVEGLRRIDKVLDSKKCKDINQINLINASYYPKIFEKNLDSKENIISSYNLKRLLNFRKYPLYFDVLICRKIFTRTCPIIKFSLANIHPKLKSKVFGSNEAKGLYSGLKEKNKKLLEYNIEEFKNSIINLSKNSNKVILFYIPRDEVDLLKINNIKGRERVFLIYNKLCNDQNLPNNFNCIDGGKIIFNSLNQIQKQNLYLKGRLPAKYYSYIKTFDMGHPSKYVSKIYAQKILKFTK